MNDRFGRILKSKRTLWAGVILLVLLIGVFAVSQFFFQPWLRNKLQTTVNEKSKGIYSLKMDELDASMIGGTLTIDNLALVPDSGKWQQLNRAGSPELTSKLTEFRAGKLKLSGLNYLGLLLKKPLNINQVLLVQPVIHINQMKTDTSQSEPIHQALSGPLKDLEVKTIRIENGSVTYKKDYLHTYHAADIRGLNLEVNNLKLDSVAYTAEDRVFYARKFKASVTQSNLLLPDGFNRLKTGAVSISSDDGRIAIKNLALIPVYKPAELAHRKGEATNWIVIKVPEVIAEQVNFRAFSSKGNIAVGAITFESPKMKVFKDKLNFSSKTVRPLPHDIIQKIKSGLYIGTVRIKNMDIRYDELGEKAKRPGHMDFYNLYATITNITNHKNRMTAKNPAVAKLKFNIEGKSNLECIIRLPLLDKSGYHTVTGSVGRSDLTAMNSIIEPAYFVSFKSGTIENGTFNLKLNRNTATGRMKLNYSDFEVDLLDKSEEKKQSLPKKIISKIANKTVVKEENKPGAGGLRMAEIKVTRQKNRSVFTYWKDCLEQGLLVSAGLGNFQPGK